jgi:hypothetical protein
MKSKIVLSLVMVAAVTLGATAMATNANFTATATSSGNVMTMGTVQLQRGGEQAAQAIQMDKLFNGSNMGFNKEVTTTASINIRGSLPVVLSANILSARLPSNETYTGENGFEGNLTTAFQGINTDARWWRQYKMAITAVVTRNGVPILQRVSRNDKIAHDYDSYFDTLNGEGHGGGDTATTGISALLTSLGTLKPGDVVTLTTKMKLISDLENGHGVIITGHPTLSNEEQNMFQGESIGVDIKLVATQAQ